MAVPAAADQRLDFFEQKIRPILVDHCYQCHGPENASGKLRLDTKAGWQRGGESGPAIVPTDPAASLLYQAITYRDATLRMPPPGDADRLNQQQIRDIALWIRQGAVDPRTGETIVTEIDARAETHWAFQPVQAPRVNSGKHPVDEFIERQIRKQGFTTTESADMTTLIRRATYDLLGLPPTAGQLATRRERFPQLIDELLSSPRYGERWGRHWLDVARYSDAKDGVLMYGDARIRPFAYTYRDYVIRAFNQDKPFDQFIREQIAADQMQLPADSPDLAAMGFLTLGRMFDRNPHDVIDDQIDVITRGFLGLTAACARCHDHKFDPLPTADYYSLYGVFASSEQPYERPRIESISEAGKPYEEELQKKLAEVYSARNSHYVRTLQTARERTPDYLVAVATTDPDVSETSIFFLSLLPEQLRPQITYQWRKLISRRAFPDDPVFGPWADMMRIPVLQPEAWQQRGIDQRIIDGLVAAQPETAEDIARTYGNIIRTVAGRNTELRKQIAAIKAQRTALEGGAINLSNIIAGGNGSGAGGTGQGIHPGTGKPTTGETGFIDIQRHDQLIPVPDNPYVDGIFIPESGQATISSTGLTISDWKSSGQTWDYFKYGPSSGATVNTIEGTDYSAQPNWIMAMHANKGITFDLQAVRQAHEFQTARFKTIFGHGGARSQSQLDFAVYVDGRLAREMRNFPAQGKGIEIDIPIAESNRFLTLVVVEGGQGISHDQAILGNPRLVPDANPTLSAERRRRIAALTQQIEKLQQDLDNLKSQSGDPIAELLLSTESPVWFPESQIYYYLSRQDKDKYRGLVGQLDGISVKHKSAAARAMTMIDAESLYDPVIFQRGDPAQRGTPVPRQFLKIASPAERRPFVNGSGRLELANAIASSENPLTGRVWVNRIWMHHFGEPLVANPSDFGLRTDQPLQHELLDYLTAELIRGGWKTKPLHRLIMTSAAYQRASQIPRTAQMKEQLEKDPANQLIWHANRRRLDLEQMRDTMLVLSGKIDYAMFGRPPLITDPNNFRRTVYAFVERQNIPDVISTLKHFITFLP